MRVAIDARIVPGTAGGVAVALKTLVVGLGQLVDSDDEYVLVVGSDAQREWLSPLLGANQRLAMWTARRRWRERFPFRPFLPLVRFAQDLMERRVWPEVPLSDGFLESLRCDVLHIPTQNYVVASIPTVYNPHDLQHLRYPQFFDPSRIAWRETVYRMGCHLAHTVVVGSEWIKNDVARRYAIPSDKVQVILEAAQHQATEAPAQESLDRTRRAHGLEGSFLLFPAVSWPHKNHIRLLQAIAQLRDSRGLRVQLVCTGSRHEDSWPRIQAEVQRLDLSSQVRFLGHVTDETLRALYRLATCLVMPTLYEASSLPIFEAWSEDLPVICSNSTALPEQVRDAALLFDPMRVSAIAEAIELATTNVGVQDRLRALGTKASLGLRSCENRESVSSDLSAHRGARSRRRRQRIACVAERARKPTVNVLLVVPWDQASGGVASVVGNLAQHLTRSGHQVCFLHPGPSDRLRERLTARGFRGYELNLRDPMIAEKPIKSLVGFVVFLAHTLYQLARIVRSEKIDVVNVHYPVETFALLGVLRLLLPIRLVVSIHGADLAPEGVQRSPQKRSIRFLLWAADAIVAPSRSFLNDCEPSLLASTSKAGWIHNGVNLEELTQAGSGPPEDARGGAYLLCIAASNHKKALDVLLRAFARIGSREPALTLLVVGDGPLRGRARVPSSLPWLGRARALSRLAR